MTAAIGSSANVAATDIGISASNLVTSATVGIGVGVGGTAGVAGAVAVFSITDTTIARIAANATVHAQNNVAVLARNGTRSIPSPAAPLAAARPVSAPRPASR